MATTVLIVEDHPAVRASLLAWLGRALPDCTFVEKGSGAEALAWLAEASPSLVLMDINLPDINGIELTRRITATLPGTPVVVVSVHDTPMHRQDAAAAGAAAFVAKECMGFELLPVLQRLLPRTGAVR